MAIQMRRGAYANLDKSKLVAGEIVMSTDTNYVGIAKAPSQVLQLATTDMLELPVASTNTLGGVKVGDNLSIDSSGRLSATGGGGGTTVIANPTGTATDDLTKIQIGQTIYGVEGGSGEVIEMTYAQYQALTPQQKMDGTVRYVNDYPSGGGSGYSETVLYEGTSSSITNIVLSDSFNNYDEIHIVDKQQSAPDLTSVTVYPSSVLNNAIGVNSAFMTAYSGSGNYWGFYVRSTTLLEKTTAGGNRYPIKILGIKFGGGSGSSTLSGLTDVTVSNPTDKHALMYDSTQSKWINRDLFQHDSKILEVYGSFSSGMETTMFLIPPVSDLEYWRRTQLLYFDPEINNKHYPFIMWKYNNGTLQSVGNSFHTFKYMDEDDNERVGEIVVFGAIQNEIPCVQITYQYSLTESVTLLTEDILYVTLRAIY